MNPLTKKVGPLDVWQYFAIGTGLGLMVYLYKKNKGTEVPKEELAASTPNGIAGLGGGAGSEDGAGSLPGAPTSIPPIPGEPGPPGAPGEPGPAAPPLSEARLNTIETAIEALNNPPVGRSKVAPQGKRKPGRKKGTHHKPVKKHTRGEKRKHERAAKHQAKKHARRQAHPPKAEHGEGGHGGAVAHIQHGRPTPLAHRIAKPPAKAKPPKPKRKRH